jgi:nucleotide-binding universal stress UspA family protein
MHTFKTILFATDFSENSCLAFQAACDLARDADALVIALHVEPRPVSSIGGTQAVPPLSEEFDRLIADARLRSFRSSDLGNRLEYELAYGDPAEEITKSACKRNADIIVVGSHGRRGVKRMLLGSVAEKVLHNAPCSVLTIKTPQSASECNDRCGRSEKADAPTSTSAMLVAK